MLDGWPMCPVWTGRDKAKIFVRRLLGSGGGVPCLAGQKVAEILGPVYPDVDFLSARCRVVSVEVASVGECAPELVDVGGVALVAHELAQAEQLGAHGCVQEIGRAGMPEIVQRLLKGLAREQDGGSFPEAGMGGGRTVEQGARLAQWPGGHCVRSVRMRFGKRSGCRLSTLSKRSSRSKSTPQVRSPNMVGA